MPVNFIAAFLEAVITAIITVVLLKGQTDAEEIKARNAKVFEIKMPLFQKYIKKTWEIWENAKITVEKYREMKNLFYSDIMLYLHKDSIKNISDYLIELGTCIGKEQSEINPTLKNCTFSIINELVKNIGLGGRIDKEIHSKMEDAFSPQLFRLAVKEALDNVLVNNSGHRLLNRGEYEQISGGEYIVFPFLDNHPDDCKIMIGPFTNKPNIEILFQLYVPWDVQDAVPDLLADEGTVSDFVNIHIDGWEETQLSVSRPLKDTCLIDLGKEDCYNEYIPSFSFDDQGCLAPYRRNYTEIAFALSQRAKYIFLNAHLHPTPMFLQEYIDRLEKIDPPSL